MTISHKDSLQKKTLKEKVLICLKSGHPTFRPIWGLKYNNPTSKNVPESGVIIQGLMAIETFIKLCSSET